MKKILTLTSLFITSLLHASVTAPQDPAAFDDAILNYQFIPLSISFDLKGLPIYPQFPNPLASHPSSDLPSFFHSPNPTSTRTLMSSNHDLHINFLNQQNEQIFSPPLFSKKEIQLLPDTRFSTKNIETKIFLIGNTYYKFNIDVTTIYLASDAFSALLFDSHPFQNIPMAIVSITLVPVPDDEVLFSNQFFQILLDNPSFTISIPEIPLSPKNDTPLPSFNQ